MRTFDVISVIAVWLYLLWYAVRIQQHRSEKQDGHSSILYVWALLLSAAGVFCFRILVVQAFFDHLTGNVIPLGMWLKMVSILGADWSYLLILREIGSTSSHVMPELTRRLYPLMALLPPISLFVTMMILALTTQNFLNYARAHYLILVIIDVMSVILILSVFFPMNILMWKTEKVPQMQIKHLATMGLFLCYLSPVLLTLRRNIEIIGHGKMTPPENLGIFAVLAALCMMIQFAPFKVVTAFLWPFAYYRYLKLHFLEQRVAKMAATQPRSYLLVKPAQLDAAKYTAVISILDNYTFIPNNVAGQRIRQQIEAVIPQHGQYPDLADALAGR
jgi:hypothetical protein